MKKDYTHISVILDKSGSMDGLLEDTIGGYNQFLKTQKELEGRATMTLVQFNGNYDMISNMAPLPESEELSVKNYVPSGYTALLDAIGRTINTVDGQIEDMAKKARPSKVIFVIITDGAENASKEFTKDQIMQMINSHRDDKKWEFVFIGANQDAIQAGGSLGVRANSSLTYDASSQGTTTMYASLSKGMTSYRSRSVDESLKMGFFCNEDTDEGKS